MLLLHSLKKELHLKHDLDMVFWRLEEVWCYFMEERILQVEEPSMIFGIFEFIYQTAMFIIHKLNIKESMSIISYHGDTDLRFIILRLCKTQ